MTQLHGAEILRGWKEIEAFLGITRPSILAAGYPVRREGFRKNAAVFALRKELLDFARGRPFIGEKMLEEERDHADICADGD